MNGKEHINCDRDHNVGFRVKSNNFNETVNFTDQISGQPKIGQTRRRMSNAMKTQNTVIPRIIPCGESFCHFFNLPVDLGEEGREGARGGERGPEGVEWGEG